MMNRARKIRAQAVGIDKLTRAGSCGGRAGSGKETRTLAAQTLASSSAALERALTAPAARSLLPDDRVCTCASRARKLVLG